MTQGDDISRFSIMPDRTADYNQYQAYLFSAIDYILTNPENVLSFADYANITTVVFNYYRSDKTRAHPMPPKPDLHNAISDHLIQYFQAMRYQKSQTLQDVELLRYYAAEWDRLTIGAKRLNRLFAFINRHWVKRERDEGKKHVHEIGTLALIQWKTHFLSHIQEEDSKLTNAVLLLVAQQRDGELIDQGLVKKVVDSFVSLGLDDSYPNKECLDVYREQFENAFLQATENYYKAESEAFLTENSVSDYLKRVEERLTEEEARVGHYLHATTQEDLINKCEHTLIRAHSGLMEESVQSLLDLKKDEDLRRMYTLLSRIPEGLEPLRNRFEAHVKQAALTAITKLVGEGSTNADSIDPQAYVDTLLEVHRRNTDTVQKDFKGDTGFAASVDKACCEFQFINSKAAMGTSSIRLAELVAERVGVLLSKSRGGTKDNF